MSHVHSIYDTDLHFMIDPINRKITSESGKITLMQKDHNSERFTFQIPRYVEGHDMSLTDQVQIHYINLESAAPKRKHADVYPVIDLQLSLDSEDMVIFSWLVSGNATQYVGSLNFLVRFVCYDGSDIVYQWWSDTCSTIKIGATFDNTNSAVDLDDTDILESWRQQCIQAVFESEVFSTLEAQGTNYVEQAKSYAEQAKKISGLDTVEPLLADIETSGAAVLEAAGWYRIAEYQSDKDSNAHGAGSNMCDLVIKRGHNSTRSEYHVIRFRSVHNNQEFVSLDDKSISQLVTKIRHVVDTSTYRSYIEIYYNADVANGFYCAVQSGKDRNRNWVAMTPTLVADGTDGITVTTTYDIPVNAVPMNSVNMTETGIASAAYKLGWKIKGGNKPGVTYIKLCSRTINGTYQFADATFLLSQPYAGTYYNIIVNARIYMAKSTLTVSLTQTAGLDISNRLFYEQVSDTETGTEIINFYLQLNNYETVYGHIIGAVNMDIPEDFPELDSINYTGTGTYQAVGNADKLDGHGAEYFACSTDIDSNTDINSVTKSGMHRLNGGHTNIPDDCNYGQLLVIHGARDTIAQLAIPYNGDTIYFRAGNPSEVGGNGSWSNWETLVTTADLTNYLPLTGGDINGSVALIDRLGSNVRTLSMQNSIASVSIGAWDNGTIGMHDNTGADWIFYKGLGGTPVFKGTASGNLPLTGGTHTGEFTVASHAKNGRSSILKNSSDEYDFGTLFVDHSADGKMARIEISALNNNVKFIDNADKEFSLLHTGNMADHVLPKTGGKLNGALEILEHANAENERTRVITAVGGTTFLVNGNSDFSKMRQLAIHPITSKSDAKNALEYQYTDDGATWGVHTVHHDGNSAKTAIQESAPAADANTLWVW